MTARPSVVGGARLSRAMSGALALGAILALACGEGRPREATRPSPSAEQEVSGVIVAVAADRRTVTVDHERVEGTMASMRMDYSVDDPRLLEGAGPGTRFRARFVEKSGRAVITALELLPGSPAR